MLTRTIMFASLVALSTSAVAEPTLPEDDANPGATRQQAVEAYAKDCHANLLATEWDEGEEAKVPECEALNIEQNCNPDTFGCYGAQETCQKACQPVCTRCQDTCATGCDDCKATCKGDAACVRKCAESRADCRDRCLRGKRECQGPQCETALLICGNDGFKRASRCNSEACNEFIECRDAQEDYEKVDKICGPKVKGKLDDFCLSVCEVGYGIPTENHYADPSVTPETGKVLASKCTAASQCPTDYAAVAPYLGSFCSGSTSDASFAALAADVKRGAISKRTLSLVFNAYGAIHGYQFKKETWMNAFFYGDGAWLPETCRGKMKSVASAKVMPFYLTKLRDRVKKLWGETP